MDKELCKCGKVGNNSCPNDERCGNADTQLEQSKWEYRENFHSTGCGDYDGCYEITDGKIFLCTNDDPEDITDTENSLQQIARLMNESGCKFYSNNALELKQHTEIQELGYKIEELQAKCDKHEGALRDLKGYTIKCLKHLSSPDHKIILERIDRALSGEGEKGVENG